MDGAEREIGPLETARLRVSPATRADTAALQACLDAAPDYFVRTEGAPARDDEAAQRLDDAEADDQRALYLILPRARKSVRPEPVEGRTDERARCAVGVLDLHLGFPEPDAVHVGLLLFREPCQGLGYGREVVTALEGAAAVAGWAAVRLSVGDENPDARTFWERLGYAVAGRIDRGVTVLEKALR
ncbi:MAG TPA: GNAT family N-acetyltransferase [Anaeromyxobacteraceae bacterium]|nr:GNAT family N-acetyltransferase [Anaeromyxobacteraceae bacterium]